jgi:3-dehydroquinate dehydratase-2
VKIEVHLSNPGAREAWRHTSVITPVVDGTITGLRAEGYRLAIEAVAARLAGEAR